MNTTIETTHNDFITHDLKEDGQCVTCGSPRYAGYDSLAYTVNRNVFCDACCEREYLRLNPVY